MPARRYWILQSKEKYKELIRTKLPLASNPRAMEDPVLPVMPPMRTRGFSACVVKAISSKDIEGEMAEWEVVSSNLQPLMSFYTVGRG